MIWRGSQYMSESLFVRTITKAWTYCTAPNNQWTFNNNGMILSL